MESRGAATSPQDEEQGAGIGPVRRAAGGVSRPRGFASPREALSVPKNEVAKVCKRRVHRAEGELSPKNLAKRLKLGRGTSPVRD
jgi:hypothetical protein